MDKLYAIDAEQTNRLNVMPRRIRTRYGFITSGRSVAAGSIGTSRVAASRMLVRCNTACLLNGTCGSNAIVSSQPQDQPCSLCIQKRPTLVSCRDRH
jgi:hypothetical protein